MYGWSSFKLFYYTYMYIECVRRTMPTLGTTLPIRKWGCVHLQMVCCV